MADSDRDEDEMEDDDNNDSKKGRNGDRLPCGENREMIASILLCTARCALRKTKQVRSRPPSSFLQCMVTDAILGPCSGNPWIQLLF